jgi:hypothetical protein
MKDFWSELRIISRWVWPIALLVAGGMSVVVALNHRGLSFTRVETGFLLWGALFLFAWVVLIGYVNADSRRRGMRHIMWTLLTIFIPYGVGAVLYFVLRDPMLISCPKCSTRCRAIFVFCPQCGTELSPSCPACKRAVEPTWHRCAYCGRELERTSDPMVQSS